MKLKKFLRSILKHGSGMIVFSVLMFLVACNAVLILGIAYLIGLAS